MCADRHEVDESAIAKALGAVPDQLSEDTSRAENGGPFGIEMLSDMLLDYVAARSAEIDPRFESRESWTALKSAAELAADYVAAQHTPVGEVARAFVEYLGVGFGFTVTDEERVYTSDWIHAFHLALICRDGAKLVRLYDLLQGLPDGPETVYARALAIRWADVAGLLSQDGDEPHGPDGSPGPARTPYPVKLDGARSPGDEVTLLRALVQGDAAGFQTALAEAIARHREKAGAGRVRDLIAWGPLALAALAHESGVPVEVESGYLPVRLVTEAGPRTAEAGEPIPRPEYSRQDNAEWIERLEGKAAEGLTRLFGPRIVLGYRCSAFQRFAQDRLRAFSVRSVLDPAAEDPRQWADLVVASEATCAAFRLAAAPRESEVEVTVAGRTGSVPAPGPNSDSSHWSYAKAVAFALAARPADDLTFLGGVADEVFAKSSGADPTSRPTLSPCGPSWPEGTPGPIWTRRWPRRAAMTTGSACATRASSCSTAWPQTIRRASTRRWPKPWTFTGSTTRWATASTTPMG
ncbi:immunity 49 family protein [Actinomadura rudentiformis]|uniref:Immunity 49 family protein n=1 Tax=Actinomadura rudentiformis TaxID=359158 RepID=A0A6H9YFT2_9ACTN|nr:immunity 49 family protein [Actinomadura rudentiformis]